MFDVVRGIITCSMCVVTSHNKLRTILLTDADSGENNGCGDGENNKFSSSTTSAVRVLAIIVQDIKA
jgi:hypothetical protein